MGGGIAAKRIGGEFLMAIDYLVTDTELSDIADAIRAKGGTSASISFPNGFTTAIAAIPTGITPTGSVNITENGTVDVTNYASAIVNVSGGGSSEYELLYSGEVTVNQTSTSETTVATISVGSSILTTEKLVYVQIRDKAGRRSGYFLGSDTLYPNPTGGMVTSGVATIAYSYSNMFMVSVNRYGVYPTNISNGGEVTIRAKYHSTYSRTIDSTYTVKIYLLKWPDNISPFS